MPDLSHRPTRYAVTAMTLVALAAGGASSLHVRVGADTQLAAERRRAARLEEENRALRRRVSRQAAQPAAAKPVKTVATSAPDCARYATQEDAQRAFVADPVALRSLDGDGDGTACEQLKSASTAAPRGAGGRATATPVSADEPSAPAQEEAPPVGPTMPQAPSKAEIVASGHHFGLTTATTEEFDDLEFSLGRDATMRGYFKGWDTPFDTAPVISAWQRGEVPVMTWESRPLATTDDPTDYSLRRIANGDFDQYLTNYAHDITTLGLPLVLRFDHEMNGNWYRWCEPTPHFDGAKGDYIAAWRHVHDLFEAAGANRFVVWLWSPNRVDNLNPARFPSIDNYYPGRDYVDWVGMTGYYRQGDGTATFSATYDKTLAALRRVAPGVPILLAEVGATESGGNKVGWVDSFFPGLAANSDVVGFLWFNYATTENAVTSDWRVDSSVDVFNGFSAGLAASTYGRQRGKPAVLVPRTGSEEPATTSATASEPTSERDDNDHHDDRDDVDDRRAPASVASPERQAP